jgi:hypothetical protein
MHLPFHSMETSSSLADKESAGGTNLQCCHGTSVVWPSHARDWSRQHILPLRLDSRVVTRSGENLVGKPLNLY